MRKILIFDIDDTISYNCFFKTNKTFKPGKEQIFLSIIDILRNAFIKNWDVYIVTARRLTDFKNIFDLFTYNVPELIVKALLIINKDKPLHEWIFFNENSNSPGKYVETLNINKNRSYTDLFNSKETKWRIDAGIRKMCQISEIVKNESWNNVIFFDDSKYNFKAWKWWIQNINPNSQYMTFIGGKDICVFDDVIIKQLCAYDFMNCENLVKF